MKKEIVKHSAKRLLAVVMTLVMLAGLLPVYALAAEKVTDAASFTAALEAAEEGGEIRFAESTDELELGGVSITKNITVVLDGQTLKGYFDVAEGKTLTLKGAGHLTGHTEDTILFVGAGTAVIELDGTVKADALNTVAIVGDGDAVTVTLDLKRGEFEGVIAIAEDKTFADCIGEAVCEIKDGDSWKTYEETDVPAAAFRIRPAGEPARPEGLRWDGETASWSAANGAESYKAVLSKDGAAVENGAIEVEEGLSADFASLIKEDGTYTFTVTAVNGEVVSLPSAVSPEYKRDTTAPKITDAAAVRDSQTAATVTFKADEAGTYHFSGDKAALEADPGEGTAFADADTPVEISLTLTETDKEVKYYLLVKDAAGNKSDIREVTVPEYITYTVTLPTGEGFTAATEQSTTVLPGGSFVFTVEALEGYDITEVKWGDTELEKDSDGKYTVSAVNASGEIAVTAQKKSFGITVSEGIVLKDADGNVIDTGALRLVYGDSFEFTAELAEGYRLSSGESLVITTVPALDASAGETDKISNITSDVTVTAENVEKISYTVTLPTGEGFTAAGETGAAHGADYTFTVTVAEGYENAEVKVNDETVTGTDGSYTVTNVTADLTITVTVSKQKFAVTTEGEGFVLEPVTDEADYGSSYTFAVDPAEGWEVGESGLTVSVDGTAITPADGKYTVANITKATVIKVEGMVKKTCTVTLPTGEGFTVTADSGSNTVTYGEDFKFTVTVDGDNGYVQSPDFAVKVGDTALVGENGRYTIPAVTEDKTVSVTGVSLSSFNIQVSTGGYTITAMAGSKNPAPYGSSYKFKLELKPGYMKTADFAVKANSTPLTADSSGVYTVENIRANTTIEIFGVSNGTYNITFSSDAGYTVTPVNSSLPVAYNGSYSFKVEPNPGYVRGNAFSVKQDGLAMSPDANGVYTIYNIQQNHNVTVSGVVAASTAVSYSVTLSGGTGFTYSAQNGSASPVAPGGSYSFKVNLANGYTKGTNFAVKVNGNTLSAYNGVYTISNINANQTVTVTGVVKSAATGGTTVAAAPSITTTTLPAGAMGTAYRQTLRANGQNLTWSYTGNLPNGLTLNTATGVISGTPTLNGTFRFAVKATNNAGSNTKQLTITVTGEEYKISDGQKAEWTQGGEEGICFQTDSKADFVKVQVDGKDVPARYVETAEDGTAVTVKSEYLEELDNGTHTVSIVYADGSAKTTFTVAAEDKSEPPTIVMQPESQTANSGDKITFTVMADGTTPLICQWQVDKNDGNGWQNITGAVNASYTVTTDTVHHGYKFRCTVTNGVGSVTSDEAVLTVAGAEAPAEEGEEPGEVTEPVKEKSNVWLWITVAAVAAVGIAAAGVIVYRNRKFYNE